MVVLFIIVFNLVVRCYGAWCQEVDPQQFNNLLRAGALELVFDAGVALKIFFYKRRE